MLICVPIFSQSQVSPAVIDNGGGRASASGKRILVSLGQGIVPDNRGLASALEVGFITTNVFEYSAISESQNKPEDLEIGHFHPNPFNGATAVNIEVLSHGVVTLEIFDLKGKICSSMSDERYPGTYKIVFEPSEYFTTGIYLYRLTINDTIYKGKIIYVK